MGGISLCKGQETNTLTTDVSSFDVQSAMTNMQELKTNLDDVIQQLYALDEKERGTGAAISDKYRSTRTEIVNVIQTINQTSDNIEQQLLAIAGTPMYS